MRLERASGILLHPTSLPSLGPIGDLGPAAHEFVTWLAKAGQSVWQVLPMNPVGMGNSPYSAISAFAGNPALISLEQLVSDGWLETSDLAHAPRATSHADYEAVQQWKMPLLRKAAHKFIHVTSGKAREQVEMFGQFCRARNSWLEDFVLFQVLRDHHGGASWHTWPRSLARREPEELQRIHREFATELQVERALQFAFFRQWDALRRHAHSLGVRILGDIAIFVNFDGADVWSHPELFKLDADLNPTVVAGVPPDHFSKTGQRWGNPIYHWDVMHAHGYSWWVERVRWNFVLFDLLRLDHFRGFDQHWEIPANEKTAERGQWVDGPRDALFLALKSALGDLALIAEDLGTITPPVHELLKRLDMPGMKVLQFAFGGSGDNPYLPHNYPADCVVYTGTHDNDTVAGWWHSLAKPARQHAAEYLGVKNKSDVIEAMIRAALTSVAKLAIIPMQDVLDLGPEARMNTPSHHQGNWAWRMGKGMLKTKMAEELNALIEVSGRAPHRS